MTHYQLKLVSEVLKRSIYTNLFFSLQGDGGAGLIYYQNNSTPILVGVTAFVHVEGCHKGGPAGYMRISSYLRWIKGITSMYANID